MHNGLEMQRATQASLSEIVDTLCAAFADDPGLSWIWPDRDDRVRRLPHFFQAIVGGALANGVVLHTPASISASLWRLPGRIYPDKSEIAGQLSHMAKAFGGEHERSLLMGDTLRRHQPDGTNWWYLQFVGARPEAQGNGLGGAAIRAGLTLARAAGQPIHVEVFKPDNLGFYQHLGFKVVGEFDIPNAGPHVWAMAAR